MITGGQAGGGPVTVTLTVGSTTTTTPAPTRVTSPPAPASPPTTVTVAHPHGPLPFTGAQVPIELGASAICVLAGLLVAAAGRRRRAPVSTP